jgi:hypothetical protein
VHNPTERLLRLLLPGDQTVLPLRMGLKAPDLTRPPPRHLIFITSQVSKIHLRSVLVNHRRTYALKLLFPSLLGLHATAGPLPPPPRATFNIPVSSTPPPRPPRLHSPVPPSSRTRGDIEAVKHALQLPPSVAATLASRASSSSLSSSRTPSKIPEEEKTPTKKMVK